MSFNVSFASDSSCSGSKALLFTDFLSAAGPRPPPYYVVAACASESDSERALDQEGREEHKKNFSVSNCEVEIARKTSIVNPEDTSARILKDTFNVIEASNSFDINLPLRKRNIDKFKTPGKYNSE